MNNKDKVAIIIGAGPAGLTTALELIRNTDIKPIILEKSNTLGGISKTVKFGKNRMDIGGHRFFSKSDEIIKWWLDILPIENDSLKQFEISYQNQKHLINNESLKEKNSEDVILVRNRKSRIFYNNIFFDYPIRLSFKTIFNLGFMKMFKITLSYIKYVMFPIKEEKNLEDFFINRFGRELYLTFFKSYTEKVWGKKCADMEADWGRQRIKGLSVWKAFKDAFLNFFRKKKSDQKEIETSLIEYFLYPKYGPGQMWETVGKKIIDEGGEIIFNAEVTQIKNDGNLIKSVSYNSGSFKNEIVGDYFLSTMSMDQLFSSFTNIADEKILNIAQKLEFRNFITVGILLKDFHLSHINDNWIYIHDPSVNVGRVQFFHNWSPGMVEKRDNYLVGLEYFCSDNDELWNKSKEDFIEMSKEEMIKIGLIKDIDSIIDIHIEKVEKAYPIYSGAYKDFYLIREFLNSITNLYPIGRNGMHRYNNQDHSMLTAFFSIQSILGNYDKEKIWEINADQEYHEGK